MSEKQEHCLSASCEEVSLRIEGKASLGSAAEGNASTTGGAKQRFKRWTPGVGDKLRHLALTQSCTVSLQLLFGQAFICLFIFVPQLAFPNACIASIFLYTGTIQRQDLHLASYLSSATKILGAITCGSTLAGVVLTLALLPPGPSLFWLCFFAVLGVAIVSTVRVATDLGTGTVTGIIFGIAMVAAPPAALPRTWTMITEFYMVGLLTAAATLVGGCLVLPTMARNALRSTVSQILTDLAASISTHASHLFVPAEHADAACGHTPRGSTDMQDAEMPELAMISDEEREAASTMREQVNAHDARDPQSENEHASSEGQPTVLAGARQWFGARFGHYGSSHMADQRMPWQPGCRVRESPLRKHACEPLTGASGGPPPFTGGSAGAAVLASPFAGEGAPPELGADAQGQPSTSPCAPAGPLPEPDLGLDRQPATPPAPPQSPLTHAHSAAALRAGLPSVKRLRMEALAGHAQSFINLGPARGGVEDRETLRARARAGELRSLMALHVYEHGVEEIAKVVHEYQDFLREASDPMKPSQPFHTGRPGKPRPISALQPVMLLVRRLADESKLEPPWLANVPVCGSRWGIALDAISSLLTRSSALESMLEGSEPCLAEDELKELLGHNVIPLLRLLYAQAAATCNALARALSCKCPRKQVELPVLMEPSWAVLEFELASALHGVLKNYWHSQQVRRKTMFRPRSQIRALLYVGALSNGILEALAHAERAITNAIVTPVRHLRPPLAKVPPRPLRAVHLPMRLERLSEMAAPVRLSRRNTPTAEVDESVLEAASHKEADDVNDRSREEVLRDAEGMLAIEECLRKRTSFKSLEEALVVGADARSDSGSSQGLRSAPVSFMCRGSQRPLRQAKAGAAGSDAPATPVSFIRSVSQRPLRQAEAEAAGRSSDAPAAPARKPAAGANPQANTGAWATRARHLFAWAFNWAWPHIKQVASVPTATALYTIATRTLPSALRSRAALRKALKGNRNLQFFLKYFTANSIIIVVILVVQDLVPASREWDLRYAMTTVCVVLSEKVDTTLSKGVLRILGTISGGAIGFGAMASVPLANNAWGLACVVCLFTFLVAPVTLTHYKYAAFLFIITLHTIILCQWTFTPGGTGSTVIFYARVTDIAIGVVIVLLFDLIYPWYTSAAAAETLGSAFCEATKLTHAYFEAFAEELQLAAGVQPHSATQGYAKEAHGSEQNAVDLEEGAAKVARGLAALERNMLNKITKPLASVQQSLTKEVVIWKHGVLVLPPIIHDTVRCMEVLHDRLAALELMLLQKPIVSGRYSGVIHQRYMLPLRPYYEFTLRRALELGEAIQAVLAEDASMKELVHAEAAIERLQQSRVQLREATLRMQHSANVEMAAGTDPYMRMRTPDDSIRYQSTTYALVRVMDKTVLLARTVLADEWIQAARTGRHWRQLKVWMGVLRSAQGGMKAAQA